MAQVTLKWIGNPPCGATSPPYVGEEYILYLNQSLFTSDVTGGITVTYVSEGPGGPGYERTYTFEVPDSAIPDGVSEINSCHVKAIACQDSCCAEITRQLNDLEERVSTVSALTQEGDTEVTLTLTASQIALGFTTEHISGMSLVSIQGDNKMWLADTVAATMTDEQVTVRLSGTEAADCVHKVTATLVKPLA